MIELITEKEWSASASNNHPSEVSHHSFNNGGEEIQLETKFFHGQ